MNEKATAIQRTLFEGVIDAHGGFRNDVHVVDIGDDADDALRLRRARTCDLQHRIGPEHMAIDRVQTREHALRECLADDGNRLSILRIAVIKVATLKNGNAKRGEKSWRDYPILRARVLLTC